jgi:hypothetical protein
MINAIKKSLGSTFIPFFWFRQGFFIDIRGIIYDILALKTNMYNGNNPASAPIGRGYGGQGLVHSPSRYIGTTKDE